MVDESVYAIQRENRELKITVARLREELASANDKLYAFGSSKSADFSPKILFDLTRSEAALFDLLMLRGYVAKAQIMGFLYATSEKETPDYKVVTVFVCKMRKKLKTYDVGIDTVWGAGYMITAENKNKIKIALSAFRKTHVQELVDGY